MNKITHWFDILFSKKPKKISHLTKVEKPKIVGKIDIDPIMADEAYRRAYKYKKRKKK